MQTIVRMKFGSHLYGTSTPASDVDFKSVFIPDARDILLQCAPESISIRPKKPAGAKNAPGDIDEEAYSLQKFLDLVAEGQTVALDMLFAPRWAMVGEPHPLWATICMSRDLLISKKASSFVGYCRTQANKYGIKGSRVAAVRLALKILDTCISLHGTTAKLGIVDVALREALDGHEHIAFVDLPSPGDKVVTHLEVCNRKMPYTSSIKNARDLMGKMVAEYGQRALQAEKNEGVDWKALSHAVRVGHEALELLTTGEITFPLANAKHILQIKFGQLSYNQVAEEIEHLLNLVESATAASTLPAKVDRNFIDDLVANAYARAVDSYRAL